MPSLDDYLALLTLEAAKAPQRLKRMLRGERPNEFYEEFFQAHDHALYDRDPRVRARQAVVLDALSRHVVPGAAILDVGCGLGDVLAALPASYRRYGVDYAAANVEYVARRLGGGADIRRGSATSNPFDDESMDACLCLEVLEHLEDDAGALAEIHRVLRPGGVLIAAVPYTHYWPQYLRLMGHYRHYNRDSFGALLGSVGLRTVEHLPNYPRWHQALTRRYVWVRLQSLVGGRIAGTRDIYEFRWPWDAAPSMERAEAALQTLKREDESLDYEREPTSTFVVAQKGGAPT